jgi:glycosyltransferase involved in cell wall biosynthesis
MPENLGVSMARNTGLAQSFGDYALLLDDDVQPDDCIIDACALFRPAAVSRLALPRP